MRCGRIATLVMVILAAVLCSRLADGAIITIAIEGVVDYVEDRYAVLPGDIKAGAEITGTYSYDTSTPDSNPSAWVGDYEQRAPGTGISLIIGGYEFETDPTNVLFIVEIINDSVSGGAHDAYGVISYNNKPVSRNVSVDTISWWLHDPSATVLSSDSLLEGPPLLEKWESKYGLRLDGQRRSYVIGGTVTSAELIPEPGSLLLVVLGALIARRQK